MLYKIITEITEIIDLTPEEIEKIKNADTYHCPETENFTIKKIIPIEE